MKTTTQGIMLSKTDQTKKNKYHDLIFRWTLKTLSDINHSRILYDPPSQNIGNKSKNKQMGPNET